MKLLFGVYNRDMAKFLRPHIYERDMMQLLSSFIKVKLLWICI